MRTASAVQEDRECQQLTASVGGEPVLQVFGDVGSRGVTLFRLDRHCLTADFLQGPGNAALEVTGREGNFSVRELVADLGGCFRSSEREAAR